MRVSTTTTTTTLFLLYTIIIQVIISPNHVLSFQPCPSSPLLIQKSTTTTHNLHHPRTRLTFENSNLPSCPPRHHYPIQSTTWITATSTKSQLFSLPLKHNDSNDKKYDNATMRRRTFVSEMGIKLSATFAVSLNALLSSPPNTLASSDDDLTRQLFNEDGSLKDGAMNGITVEDLQAREKQVSVIFPMDLSTKDESIGAIVSIDGKDVSLSSTINNNMERGIRASYNVPEKWTAAPDYLDTLLSSRAKACDRISVYQVPGTFSDYSTLDKATTVGVAKALGFHTVPVGVLPKTLLSADIVSGRKVSKVSKNTTTRQQQEEEEEDKKEEESKRMYYEFDLAVAPDTCGNSAENLGLGFCPYDTIVLLSATIIDKKMMVCAVTCTKEEWKRDRKSVV